MADLLFDLPKTKRPPAIERSSVGCAEFRNTLTRRWGPSPLAVWLMLNPSTAGADTDDPTSWRVIEFSYAWGYDGALIVNFAPYRSPKPADLWRWLDWEANGPDYHARDRWQANLQVIEDAGRQAAIRVVAFGAELPRRHGMMLDMVLERFRQPSDIGAGERLYCLGVNAEGSPLHPMARGRWRVPDGTRPQLWGGIGRAQPKRYDEHVRQEMPS